MPCTERRGLAALSAAVALGLSGCAGGPASLTRDGALRVETVSSPAALVWWADVRADTGKVWVTGEVIRDKEWPAVRPGHVDIELVNRSGPRIPITNGALQPVQTAAGNSRRLAFRMDLPERPSPGSTVRVIHHATGDSY